MDITTHIYLQLPINLENRRVVAKVVDDVTFVEQLDCAVTQEWSNSLKSTEPVVLCGIQTIDWFFRSFSVAPCTMHLLAQVNGSKMARPDK